MKLLIASDLHFEFYTREKWKKFVHKMPEADVLVCPGDLATPSIIERALQSLLAKYKHVVFVAGNHEFYGSDFQSVRDKILEIQYDSREDHYFGKLHFLDNSVCAIDDGHDIAGQRFVGSTMWFPYDKNLFESHGGRLNDFRKIVDAETQIYEENKRGVEFLRDEVSPGDIVVTHHLPSMRSVAAAYEGDPFNGFFVCEMDDLIKEVAPKMWIHGHTHSSCDYEIDMTRVVCNPFGYKGYEPNQGFNNDLIIEI